MAQQPSGLPLAALFWSLPKLCVSQCSLLSFIPPAFKCVDLTFSQKVWVCCRETRCKRPQQLLKVILRLS